MDTIVKPPRTGKEAFEMLPEGTLCQLITDTIVMSPAPNTQHAIIQTKIFTALYNHVVFAGMGTVLFAPVDVYLDDKNIFQPDIFFIGKEHMGIIKTRGIYGAPDLVVEILSEDRRYDLVTKKQVYERTGVQEYWVVDPVSKWCEGFVLVSGLYQSVGEATGQLMVQMFDLAVVF